MDEARANLATSKANLGLAKVTAQRYDGLRGSDAVSRQSIDTAVQTENVVVDEGREREVVEQVGEVLPHVRVPVLSQTLVVEAVHLRDLPRLVVAA